jgi:hypothetical protein
MTNNLRKLCLLSIILTYIGDVLVFLFEAFPDLETTKTQIQRSYGWSPVLDIRQYERVCWTQIEFHFRRLVFTSLKHVYP